MKRFSFGKLERLCKQKEIQHVFSVGTFMRSKKLKIVFTPNQQELKRCCVIVPLKTTSRSIILRNRIRRLLKETYRLNKHYLQGNIDIIILFSPYLMLKKDELKNFKQADLEVEFMKVCKQAGLVK